jgi:uncharacterized protein (DUF3084 family)
MRATRRGFRHRLDRGRIHHDSCRDAVDESRRADPGAELDNPHSETNKEVVSMMLEAARLMATEARGENERALFTQAAINARYRELDEREARLEDRDKRVTAREMCVSNRDQAADQRDAQADERERDQMEHDLRVQRQG